MSKKPRFRGCFEKQYGTHAQALLKSVSQNLYHIHWSVARKLCSKKSLLLTCQMLGLLFNTLGTNEGYLVLNRNNLTIPIQIQLSQKKTTFCEMFVEFLKFILKFEYLERKITLTAFLFPKLRTRKT